MRATGLRGAYTAREFVRSTDLAIELTTLWLAEGRDAVIAHCGLGETDPLPAVEGAAILAAGGWVVLLRSLGAAAGVTAEDLWRGYLAASDEPRAGRPPL